MLGLPPQLPQTATLQLPPHSKLVKEKNPILQKNIPTVIAGLYSVTFFLF